jgi:DNA-binding GntR family transcriptional regulator
MCKFQRHYKDYCPEEHSPHREETTVEETSIQAIMNLSHHIQIVNSEEMIDIYKAGASTSQHANCVT